MEGEDTSRDLGRDKELCPARENHRQQGKSANSSAEIKAQLCVSREVLCFSELLLSQPLKDVGKMWSQCHRYVDD